MRFDFPSDEYLGDELVQPLITGWAKSRAGKNVTVIHEHGRTHCMFTMSIIFLVWCRTFS